MENLGKRVCANNIRIDITQTAIKFTLSKRAISMSMLNPLHRRSVSIPALQIREKELKAVPKLQNNGCGGDNVSAWQEALIKFQNKDYETALLHFLVRDTFVNSC